MISKAERLPMNEIKGHRLYVKLGASQVRRRLKGLGYGVRKVESAGRGEAVIVHTATGQHLRELRAIFQDVLAPETPRTPAPARGVMPDELPTVGKLRSLCVFCGSSTGSVPAFRQAAETLGKALVRHDITLVYGGGNIGLMGVIADRVMQGGGRAIGVIPRQLQEKELAHQGITDLRVVDSMHQRKALMAELAEGFIALPGGYGTIEEFSEVLTWSQLGLHAKPMGLLNVSGYFGHFLAFLDHAVDVHLLRPEHRQLVLESEGVEDLLQCMQCWQAPELPKWIRPDET
jgi:uncharacterized protein (TIGR00730 family)